MELKCLSEYQSIVRIINKLAKDGYKFSSSRALSTVPRGPIESSSSSIQTDLLRSRSRERTIEYTWNKSCEAYVRLSNLPWDCTVGDIREFMDGIMLRTNVSSLPLSDPRRTLNFRTTWRASS